MFQLSVLLSCLIFWNSTFASHLQSFGFEPSERVEPSPVSAGGLGYSGGAPATSSDFARNGLRSFKFHLNRLTSTHMYRTEAAHQVPLMEVNKGAKTQDYWTGFSVYIPDPYPVMAHPVYELFFQNYMQPPNGDWAGYPNNSPPIALYLSPKTHTSGEIGFLIRASDGPYPQPFPLPTVYSNKSSKNPMTYTAGRWHDFVIHSRLDSGKDGFIKIWLNGKLSVDYSGPNYARGHGGANRKFGIYNGWRTRDIPGETVNTRTLYFDEYRFGYGDGVDYHSVAPRGKLEGPVLPPDPPTGLRGVGE